VENFHRQGDLQLVAISKGGFPAIEKNTVFKPVSIGKFHISNLPLRLIVSVDPVFLLPPACFKSIDDLVTKAGIRLFLTSVADADIRIDVIIAAAPVFELFPQGKAIGRGQGELDLFGMPELPVPGTVFLLRRRAFRRRRQ